MLAKKVRVNVYGEISNGFYSGYSNGDGVNNVSSYVISRKNICQ